MTTRPPIRRLLVILALWGAAASLRAQVLPFDVKTLRDGLPQSQMASMVQDPRGYIWVGTWGGLARYNGSVFHTFTTEDGLPSNRIQEMIVDSRGTLWVATAGGVATVRDGTVTAVKDPAVSDVRCRAILEDRDGVVWLGTDRGLYRFLPGSRRPEPTAVGPATQLVSDLASDRGALLVAGSQGLWRREPEGAVRPLAIPCSRDQVRTIAATADGLWLGTATEGLFLQSAKGWESLLGAGAVSGRSVYRIQHEPSGTLYVCTTDSALFLRRPGRTVFEHWDTEMGLPSNVVNFAFEDREGNVWVGTDINGLARLGGVALSNHGEKQGLPSACVFGIAPGGTPDSLWLGTLRGAVHYQVRPVPRVLETIRLADGLDTEWVWKVLPDADGGIWVLTDTALFHRARGRRRLEAMAPSVPVPRAELWDAAFDAQGRLWVCGRSDLGGLICRDRAGRWRTWLKTEAGAPFTYCAHIVPRRAGGVWATSGMEVFYCDGETLVRLPVAPPLDKRTYISGLFEDSAGRLWAGSDAGLAVMGGDGRWTLMNQQAGFTSHHVYSIGEDLRRNVWVGTTRGVFRFGTDGRIDNFTPEDGLAGYETNQYGFLCTDRGEIWIGTVDGLSQYDPSRHYPNTTPPNIVVESAALPDRRIDFPQSLELDWDERSVAFQVAVLSFRNRNRVGYRARLEGLEENWLPVRQLAELRYTNLPSGKLRLLLQAVNESGIWSEAVALPITVRPPFWLTTWFQGTLVALALGAVVGVHRWRTVMLRRRTRELEAEVGKRTTELQDANRRLTHLATYEPLTGLLNRRAIMERLEEAVGPAGRGNRQFGCILVDLNKFKAVNDMFGHSAGDEVLREMARCIEACLRDGDALGRSGGDEFLILLPGAGLEAVDAVARRIAALSYTVGEAGAAITVTAACGGVAVPGRSDPALPAVLAQADALMYAAKKAGPPGIANATYQPPAGG
jgi:diguanylate cyclase (GGDEF)-like protein